MNKLEQLKKYIREQENHEKVIKTENFKISFYYFEEEDYYHIKVKYMKNTCLFNFNSNNFPYLNENLELKSNNISFDKPYYELLSKILLKEKLELKLSPKNKTEKRSKI